MTAKNEIVITKAMMDAFHSVSSDLEKLAKDLNIDSLADYVLTARRLVKHQEELIAELSTPSQDDEAVVKYDWQESGFTYCPFCAGKITIKEK